MLAGTGRPNRVTALDDPAGGSSRSRSPWQRVAAQRSGAALDEGSWNNGCDHGLLSNKLVLRRFSAACCCHPEDRAFRL